MVALMERPQKLARKAENLTAASNGGRVTPRSGSGQLTKNDSRNDDWSFEDKSTSATSFSLKRDVLAAAEHNAVADGRRMALVVTFFPPRAIPGRPRRYVVMAEEDFLERESRLAYLEGYYETRRVV